MKGVIKWFNQNETIDGSLSFSLEAGISPPVLIINLASEKNESTRFIFDIRYVRQNVKKIL